MITENDAVFGNTVSGSSAAFSITRCNYCVNDLLYSRADDKVCRAAVRAVRAKGS